MYDRGKRFKRIYSSTPENIGPTTYYLSDTFHNTTLIKGAVPFNSTELRNTVFINKNIAENPSPNTYRIRFRKRRIIGGTSLQNKAPRLKYKVKDPRQSFITKGPKFLPGTVFVGVPHRSDANKVSTIPEKDCEGYEITDQGLFKISYPPRNRHIGPAEYYNPQAGHNYTTDKYRGTFWSLRTGTRFRRGSEEGEGPGPADYAIGHHQPTTWERNQKLRQSLRQADTPLLRTGDLLQRRLCSEGLPGPGTYSPFDPNTQKCECGKLGTFSKSQRQSVYRLAEGPGPAAYAASRTALSKVTCEGAPFGVDAKRFPKSQGNDLPGPSDYLPKGSLWDEAKSRAASKYGQASAPFQSSAARKTALARPDAGCMPGPDWYKPELQKKGDYKISSMFAGNPCKVEKRLQDMPGPATYSISEPFKVITGIKSHLKNSNSAFLSSSERIHPLRRSSSPGPTTYDLPNSTLNKKGCIISGTLGSPAGSVQPTPGPVDYQQVHSKYARSAVFDTHNVTLGPKEVLIKCRKPKNTGEKRLRCFSTKRYPTNHCPNVRCAC